MTLPESPFQIDIGASLSLTLHEAASRQVDAAIDALQAGDYDVALTLAGATLGMIERKTGHYMFGWPTPSYCASRWGGVRCDYTVSVFLRYWTVSDGSHYSVAPEEAAFLCWSPDLGVRIAPRNQSREQGRRCASGRLPYQLDFFLRGPSLLRLRLQSCWGRRRKVRRMYHPNAF